MKILVFLEQRNGDLKSSCKEALTAAYKLAGQKSENITGLIIGHNVKGLTEKVKNYGVDQIYIADTPELEVYNPVHYSHVFANAVTQFNADTVLGIASPMGRDLFARVAAKLDTGLLTDLTEINQSSENFLGGTKPMYAGKVLAKVNFNSSCKIKMATLRPNVFPANENPGQANATVLEVSLAETKIKTTEISKSKAETADLTEATRIISGGQPWEMLITSSCLLSVLMLWELPLELRELL